MTGAHCAMFSCSNAFHRLNRWRKKHDCKASPSSPKDRKKKCPCKPPFTLHNFPTEKKNPDGRKRWAKIVNRQLPQTGKPAKPWEPTKNSRICSEHFRLGAPSEEYPDPCLNLGKPAYEMLDSDPDWVPSLHLGHNDDEGEGNSRNKRRRLSSEEKPAEGADGAADVRKPPPPPWKEVKTALQSLLESRTTVTQQPGDDAQNRAAGKRTDTSFRDFFRSALESSLEASIQARARSKSRSSSTEYQVKLNFKLLSPGMEPATLKDSSSSCVNCSRMLRRIEELEHKLFELASKQEQADSEEASAAGTQPDQGQHGSEEEQDMYESTVHVETVEVLDFSSEGEPDSEAFPLSSEPSDLSSSSSTSSGSAPSTSHPPPAASGPPYRPRFRKEWLKDFPFLRYSPTLNVMWCYVCRVHSDAFCRNNRLIKGSCHFTKTNITKHCNSVYHQQNMQRFLWSSQRPSVGPQHERNND